MFWQRVYINILRTAISITPGCIAILKMQKVFFIYLLISIFLIKKIVKKKKKTTLFRDLKTKPHNTVEPRNVVAQLALAKGIKQMTASTWAINHLIIAIIVALFA